MKIRTPSLPTFLSNETNSMISPPTFLLNENQLNSADSSIVINRSSINDNKQTNDQIDSKNPFDKTSSILKKVFIFYAVDY